MKKVNEKLTELIRLGDEQTCLQIIHNLSDIKKSELLKERNSSEVDLDSRAEMMIPANNLIDLAIENNMKDLAYILITIADPASFKYPDNVNAGLLKKAAANGMHNICEKLIPLLSDHFINSSYSTDFLALKYAINNKWQDVCLLLIPKITKECLMAMKEEQNHNLMNMAFNNHMKNTYYALENLMHHYELNPHDQSLGVTSVSNDYW